MEFFDRDGKFNWVDENNVYLGYDNHQDCCEWADWYLAEECQQNPDIGYDTDANLPQELDWENWVFDTNFFYQGTPVELEAGGLAVFKLLRKKPKLGDNPTAMYLHIFNSHNGYYGHGFEFKIPESNWPGTPRHEGTL